MRRKLTERKDHKGYKLEQNSIKTYLDCVLAFNLPRSQNGKNIEYALYVEKFGKPGHRFVLVGYTKK